MQALNHQFPGIPDVFYSLRIKHLVKSGTLEAAGNLNRMRFSEVASRILANPTRHGKAKIALCRPGAGLWSC
jgi:hypothetical protein